MRHAPRALAGGLLVAAAVFVTACGSSAPGLLSSQQAGELNGALDRISAKFHHHHCVSAQAQAANFRQRIAQLPGSVNATVRRSLDQGALTVEQYVAQDCIQQPAPQAAPPPATTTTTQTTPTTSTHTKPAPPPKTTGTTTNPNATPPPNAGNKSNGHGHGPKPQGSD